MICEHSDATVFNASVSIIKQDQDFLTLVQGCALGPFLGHVCSRVLFLIVFRHRTVILHRCLLVFTHGFVYPKNNEKEAQVTVLVMVKKRPLCMPRACIAVGRNGGEACLSVLQTTVATSMHAVFVSIADVPSVYSILYYFQFLPSQLMTPTRKPIEFM